MREVRWQELTEQECHKLLADRHLAGCPGRRPPGALDEGAVVFRTDPGSKLTPP